MKNIGLSVGCSTPSGRLNPSDISDGIAYRQAHQGSAPARREGWPTLHSVDTCGGSQFRIAQLSYGRVAKASRLVKVSALEPPYFVQRSRRINEGAFHTKPA